MYRKVVDATFGNPGSRTDLVGKLITSYLLLTVAFCRLGIVDFRYFEPPSLVRRVVRSAELFVYLRLCNNPLLIATMSAAHCGDQTAKDAALGILNQAANEMGTPESALHFRNVTLQCYVWISIAHGFALSSQYTLGALRTAHSGRCDGSQDTEGRSSSVEPVVAPLVFVPSIRVGFVYGVCALLPATMAYCFSYVPRYIARECPSVAEFDPVAVLGMHPASEFSDIGWRHRNLRAGLMFPNIPGDGEEAKFLATAKAYETLMEPVALANWEQYGGRPNWEGNPSSMRIYPGIVALLNSIIPCLILCLLVCRFFRCGSVKKEDEKKTVNADATEEEGALEWILWRKRILLPTFLLTAMIAVGFVCHFSSLTAADETENSFNPYEILGLEPGENDKRIIRRAYQILSFRFYPD